MVSTQVMYGACVVQHRRKGDCEMRTVKIMLVLGAISLIAGIGSVPCLGGVTLGDESMATIVGACPGWYCGGDNPCQSPECDPAIGGSCYRCSASAVAQGCREALIGGARNCSEGVAIGGCGTGIYGWCLRGLDGQYSCQGGQPSEIPCDRKTCTTSN